MSITQFGTGHTTVIDTLSIARKLSKTGVKQAQAEAFANIFADVVVDAVVDAVSDAVAQKKRRSGNQRVCA